GAPSWWIPLEPASVTLQVAGISKNAPHMNAAKLFLEYMISEEGQKIFRDAGYLPVDPNVPPEEKTLLPENGKFHALTFTPEDVQREMPRWTKTFQTVFR